MARKTKKRNFISAWLIAILVCVSVFLAAIYFYNTTGLAVEKSSDSSGISDGAKCSDMGAVACCENCGCKSDESPCACTCSVVNNRQIWVGSCCEDRCSNGKCLSYECSSDIPLGYSCYNNYERYGKDLDMDGCADGIVTRRCKSVCVNGMCADKEYAPSCYFSNPINSDFYPSQCMDDQNGLQWSMSCYKDNYDGILCAKGCDKETGKCN